MGGVRCHGRWITWIYHFNRVREARRAAVFTKICVLSSSWLLLYSILIIVFEEQVKKMKKYKIDWYIFLAYQCPAFASNRKSSHKTWIWRFNWKAWKIWFRKNIFRQVFDLVQIKSCLYSFIQIYMLALLLSFPIYQKLEKISNFWKVHQIVQKNPNKTSGWRKTLCHTEILKVSVQNFCEILTKVEPRYISDDFR